MSRLISTFIVVCLCAMKVQAQSSISIGVGGINVLDTYMSSENYTGTDSRLIYEWRSQRIDKKWERLFRIDASYFSAQPRAKGNTSRGGVLQLQGGALSRLATSCDALTLRVGAQGLFGIGGLYNDRGGNNPGQARVVLNVGPIVGADYSFTLGNLPFKMHYEASAPLLGLMFSPNYGQSYYELFSRGDYDRNIVPTTIIATPSLRQQLTLDIPVCGKTLRLGYLGDSQQSHVNNLKYHSYTHSIILGMQLGK